MKSKNIRRSLLGSIISLILCCSMLVGTTFAWFTDSVQSGMNVIASGNLDIELEYYVDETDDNIANGTWASVSDATDLFTENLWEPGHTEVVYLKLRNVGSLALQYNFSINISETKGTNVFNEEFALSDYICMGVVKNAEPAYTDRAKAIEAAQNGVNGVIGKGHFDTGFMLAGQEDLYLAVVVYMPEDVGNKANYMTGTTRPEINLGIKLYATQYMYESDSFDETYDDITTIADYSQYKQYMKADDNSGTYLVIEDFSADDIIHWGSASDVTMDLDDKTIDAAKKGQFLFGAQNGGILRLTGNGTVNAGRGFMANKLNAQIIIDGGTYNMDSTAGTSVHYHSIAQKTGQIIINGGTFRSSVADACLFYASENATIEITGGFFENTVDSTPDLLDVGTNKTNTNRIILKGGTFVNYNPLEDVACYTGEWPGSYDQFSGPHIIIWEGYKVVSETQAKGDVWYSVVPA